MTRKDSPMQYALHEFSPADKSGLYKAIYERRDVRRDFLPDLVPEEILNKLLDAAHHAGSVGFMQPWSFIVIRDVQVKTSIKALFERANQREEGIVFGSKAGRNSRGTVEHLRYVRSRAKRSARSGTP